MVQLGSGFMILDLVRALNCPVLLVAANRLGAINHVLLSVQALEGRGCSEIRVVLNEISGGERRLKRTNEVFLRKSIAPKPLISLGFMGLAVDSVGAVKKCAKKFKKPLALALGFDSLLELFGTNEGKNGEPKKRRLTAGVKPGRLVSQ